MASQQLDHLLQQCTVRLSVQGGHGTGFFVAPGLILTCAHVVERAESGLVDVFWKENNQHYFAEIGVLPDEPNIDLALLKVTTEISNHPCVLFDQSVSHLDDRLYSFGYPEDNADGDPVTCSYEGESFRDNSSLLKLKGGQFNFGASGSPLLNRRTDGVCGIVNISRSTTTDLGGRAIPTPEILMQFPQLKKLNQQFHQIDKRWAIAALNSHQSIIRRSLGCGFGAGLALGMLRAAIAPFFHHLPSVDFVSSFWAAAVLGTALALGIAKSNKRNRQMNRTWSNGAIVSGTLFFGIAHLLVGFFNGSFSIEAPLVAPMGFLAGLGLSIALHDQPWLGVVKVDSSQRSSGSQPVVDLWGLRLMLIGLAFMLIQGIFIQFKTKGTGIVIAWSHVFYEAELSRYATLNWWQEFMTRCPEWFNYLALLDAAVVGIVFAIGMIFGPTLTTQILVRSYDILKRLEQEEA